MTAVMSRTGQVSDSPQNFLGTVSQTVLRYCRTASWPLPSRQLQLPDTSLIVALQRQLLAYYRRILSTFTAPTTMPAADINHLLNSAEKIVLGKSHQLRLALSCLLARGHLLIEDVPGVGKTTLAHTLAHLSGLQLNRIQFTSDLLPADILGTSVFERSSERFRFHPGPIFTQVLLADEINRATPRTQSALLEAMEEAQISIDGERYGLPTPFFVIATQNPLEQVGTFPLPESQLDRFLLRIELGYPDPVAEHALLKGESRRQLLDAMSPLWQASTVIQLQQLSRQIHVSDRLIDYVQALLRASREDDGLMSGLSPRAGLGLIAAARAWALLDQRDHVLPEDVQQLFPHVAGHRLLLAANGRPLPPTRLQAMLQTVTLP